MTRRWIKDTRQELISESELKGTHYLGEEDIDDYVDYVNENGNEINEELRGEFHWTVKLT